jgi:hypothetical protein
MTVPLQVEFVDGQPVTHNVEVQGAKAEITLPAAGKVAEVKLDPLYHVHHMTPQQKAELQKKQ